MPSFLPQSIAAGTGEVLDAISNPLPPAISSAAGNLIGQNGSNKIVDKISDLANEAGLRGPNGSIIQQQSAFPFKKSVSFFLKGRDGQLIKPPASTTDNFKDGYFFKMFVNPSNFAITLPPKTVVPVRTMGGWSLQYWYPELGSIKADGIIGNMLERYNRDLKESNAWRGFRKLMTVYNLNGMPQIGSNSSRKALQASFAPTAVCIFDKNQYEGYFESLDYAESEETPHTIKYSFSFRFANSLQLDDIPGITRDKSIDASIVNALVPQGAISNTLNSIKF